VSGDPPRQDSRSDETTDTIPGSPFQHVQSIRSEHHGTRHRQQTYQWQPTVTVTATDIAAGTVDAATAVESVVVDITPHQQGRNADGRE